MARAAANEMRAGAGAPSSLHLWWGNRQVAIAKGLVFAQLVDAPEFGDVERTHEVHGVLAGLLNGDPLVEPLARELIRESCANEWPTVYDPFCGVGTVPFAALALGVPAIGGELKPVASFVEGLVSAGFTITAAWPLRDMRTQAVFGGDAGTGFRSIYFVCRPARVDAEVVTHRQFSDYLRQKLPGEIEFYREMDRGLEPNDKASIAFVAGIRLFSQFAKVLNADGSVFPVSEVIAEVLKIAEELDQGDPAAKVKGDNLRELVVARIKRWENPAGIRKEVYDVYLKFEDAGQIELVSKYNDLLNEWHDLVEEMTK